MDQSQKPSPSTLCVASFKPHQLAQLFGRISSLTMNLCYSVNFLPLGSDGGIGTPKLKYLRIVENASFATVMMILDGNPPAFVQTLEILAIQSTNGCASDCALRSGRGSRFARTSGICVWRLAITMNLAFFIPNAVERLNLSSKLSRSVPFLGDMQDWVGQASDRAWLLRLRSVQLAVDLTKRCLMWNSNAAQIGEARSRTWEMTT